MAEIISSSTFHSICIFCGSADGIRPDYVQAAFQMGQELAQRGIRLVYGAGKTGLMGAVAEGVLQNGGQVTGIVPAYLNQPQLIHQGLTTLEVVENIHVRKARMSELADAFIALPGGYGTFEELFEAITWAQLGIHHKPVGLLNTRHYFDPLLQFVRHALNEGFIYPEHHDMLLEAQQPQELLLRLEAFHTPENLDRWIKRP
jgi:uncharacterized protein (TIGR00730 family)